VNSGPAKPGRIVTFLSDQGDPEPQDWFCFGGLVAGSNLVAPFLSPYAIESQVIADPGAESAQAGFDPVVFDGLAYVASAERHLVCHCQDRHYKLEIEALGVFHVDPDEQRVTHRADRTDADPDLLWQVFLGPCLPLLLANDDRYFLHASAVGNTRLTAFAAPSGFGKSTFAQFVHDRDPNRHVADDMLPVQATEHTIHIGSPVPQLKLAGLGAKAAPEPKLDRLLVLRPDVEAADPALRLLSPAQALVAVSANTIALKLFGQRHLRQHLRFSRLFAERVECLEMRYRQELSQLPAMLKAIEPL
jgi:hypothetical protein